MNLVSFGGGTNSTAMIIGMHKQGIPIDLILFADTGGEQPHTYEFIRTFNGWLNGHGLPGITPVYYTDKDGNRLTLEKECFKSGTLGWRRHREKLFCRMRCQCPDGTGDCCPHDKLCVDLE